MENNHFKPTKVAIIGTGNVGATFAFSLLTSGLASEIVLIDANKKKAEGEAMDLNHAVPLTHTARIWSGDYEDAAGAAVTVVTAGSAQKPGESRLALLQRNVEIFRSIIPQIVKHNPDGLLLIATNPVDILSYVAWKLSGLPANRVIGSGTVLDTARFRYLLGQSYDVDPRSIHAFIIGEHGDTEVPVWSLANIAGMRLDDFCNANHLKCPRISHEEIFQRTRNAAYEIIEAKGATYYAVAAGLLRIVEAILRGQTTILSVSSLITDFYGVDDVYLSLPCTLDSGGIEQTLNIELSPLEVEQFQHSAATLKKLIDQLTI
ncbi:MAG: L-lactate dehydrogenase [Anaerolineaceae bacterium]|nr:L-lactate dehydrogenase [Anaerolineaceae bacterium]